MTGDFRGRAPTPAAQGADTVKTLVLLLRKEWLVFHLRVLLAVFGVFILAALQVVYLDELYLMLGVLLAATLAVYVPFVEWFQETDPMLHSLPIHRDAVVLARYLVAILAGALAGVVWSVTGRILLPLLRAGRGDPAMWVTLEGGLTFVLVVGLMAVLFFPLYFRMGMGRGAVAFLGLALAFLLLAYATAGVAGGPGVGGGIPMGAESGAGPPPAGGFLIPPSALIRTRLSALLGSMGVTGTLTLVLVVLALALYASIRLSQHFLRKREF